MVGTGRASGATASAMLVSPSFDDRLLQRLQQRHAVEFDVFLNIAKALARAIEAPPGGVFISSAIGIDPMLQLCRSLRAQPELLETRVTCFWEGPSSDDDKQRALDAGADEVLSLSSDEGERHLRLASFSRAMAPALQEREVLVYADLKMDLARFKAWRNGTLLKLKPMPFQLLKFLMAHPTRVFSREELLRQVWGGRELDHGAVTACMARLRRALTDAGGPDVIRSVRGGYSLDCEDGPTFQIRLTR